jgi:hypothetical protein
MNGKLPSVSENNKHNRIDIFDFLHPQTFYHEIIRQQSGDRLVNGL